MKGFLILLVLAGLGAAGYEYYAPQAGSAQAREVSKDLLFAVKRGALRITVTENGYLKAKNSVEVKPKFRRSSTLTSIIDEGSEVVEGDVLAEFDKTDLQNQVDELDSTLIQYKTELEASEAELEIQKRDSGAQVESAEFNLTINEKKQEKYLEGEGPNQMRLKNLAAEKAASEFKRAKERFEQVPLLAEEGFYTPTQVEEERIRLREAEINMENAKKDLEIHEKYTDPMERAQLGANLKDARRELSNAREKSTISLKEKEARVERNKSRVKSTEQRLEKHNEELDFMTVKAPAPGVVHYGDPANPWWRDQIKVGNTLYSGNTLITLPDLREMQVLIQVHEADIDLLDEGQLVHVTVEAVKGQVFTGKVTQIASVASSDWMDEANKTFRIEVTMDPIEDIELRAGITAKAEIQVEELPGVLQVPIHSVMSEEGQHFCFVAKTGGGFEKRNVKIGKNNTHYVELKEGVDEGEKVYLYDPRITGAVVDDDESPGAPADDEEPGGMPSMGPGTP